MEIQVTTYQFWNTKGLCHPIYEVLRVDDLPPWCPMCGVRTDKSEGQQKQVGPQMCLCLIGATGVGKSSLGNMIGNLSEDQTFEVSGDTESCTVKSLSRVCTWADGSEFVLMDTPGLGDSKGRDIAHIADMVHSFKRQEYISLFVLTFNGAEVRFSQYTQDLLKIFVSMFGPDFLNNVCVVFTRWPHTQESRLHRLKFPQSSEQARAKGLNDYFATEFKYAGNPVPCFFVDCTHDTEDPLQVETHKEIVLNMKKLASGLKPFGCQDVQALQSLQNKKFLDLQAEYERKVAESKEKERIAEEKTNQLILKMAKEREQDYAKMAKEREQDYANMWEMFLNDAQDVVQTKDDQKRAGEANDRKLAEELDMKEKARLERVTKQRQETAANNKLREQEQELDNLKALVAHQKELPREDKIQSLENSWVEVATIQTCLTSGLEGDLTPELALRKERLIAKCQAFSSQLTALLSDSNEQPQPQRQQQSPQQQRPVVIHVGGEGDAANPAIQQQPADGKWQCPEHQCSLELRSMPYGPENVNNCRCERSLAVSFHCAEHAFDLCPFCAADFAGKPTWRFATHPHTLVLRHRQTWSCHLCDHKGEGNDGVVYTCDRPSCEYYACVRCAAGCS